MSNKITGQMLILCYCMSYKIIVVFIVAVFAAVVIKFQRSTG